MFASCSRTQPMTMGRTPGRNNFLPSLLSFRVVARVCVIFVRFGGIPPYNPSRRSGGVRR